MNYFTKEITLSRVARPRRTAESRAITHVSARAAVNSFKLDTTRHLPDVWFMSDSGLNWLQQLSDCRPSICRGQFKLQLLRGSRHPSLQRSSADKSNLSPWFSPHFPQPCQHGEMTRHFWGNFPGDWIEVIYEPQPWHAGLMTTWRWMFVKSKKTENVLCGHENESQTHLNEKDVWSHLSFSCLVCARACVYIASSRRFFTDRISEEFWRYYEAEWKYSRKLLLMIKWLAAPY